MVSGIEGPVHKGARRKAVVFVLVAQMNSPGLMRNPGSASRPSPSMMGVVIPSWKPKCSFLFSNQVVSRGSAAIPCCLKLPWYRSRTVVSPCWSRA